MFESKSVRVRVRVRVQGLRFRVRPLYFGLLMADYSLALLLILHCELRNHQGKVSGRPSGRATQRERPSGMATQQEERW